MHGYAPISLSILYCIIYSEIPQSPVAYNTEKSLQSAGVCKYVTFYVDEEFQLTHLHLELDFL